MDFPLFIHSKLSLRDYYMDPASPVLRVSRSGETVTDVIPGDWTVFVSNHSTYFPISCAKMNLTPESKQNDVNILSEAVMNELTEVTYVPVIEDRGTYDGVRRVLFGSGFEFWLHRLLFVDVLSYLSHGALSQPLDRYILVDIDDIFVSKPGTRMVPSDVQVLVALTACSRFLLICVLCTCM